MQTDAPVMIILGTLVVITSMASLYGILANFGGETGLSSSESNLDSMVKLKSNIENQCNRLSEYDTVLTNTVSFNLNEAEMSYDDPELVLTEGDKEVTREVDCDHDIDFNVESDRGLGAGSWEAEISGSGSTITVEVK